MPSRRDPDTDIGGPDKRFPHTRHSALAAAKSADPAARRAAFEAISIAYWKPVYAYVRLRWSATSEDAKELTQGFLMRTFERDYIASYDPARASFRTFLRVCLDRYVANERQAAGRVKRGGDAHLVDVDALSEDALAASSELESLFQREWTRALFEAAVARLEAKCVDEHKETHFALFQRYDLLGPELAERPTYEALASELGSSATQVTNHLAWARRAFKAALLTELRAACVDHDEFQSEARALLGAEVI